MSEQRPPKPPYDEQPCAADNAASAASIDVIESAAPMQEPEKQKY